MDNFLFNNMDVQSSSSSSSDDEFLVEVLLKEFDKNHRPQVVNFLSVIEEYSEKQFRENFRIGRGTANILVQMYQASAHFKRKIDCGGREEIPARAQVLAFLWFAGNKNSYREVGNLFNFAMSTTFKVLTNVLEFVFEISSNYIKFPSTDEEKAQSAAKFRQIAGFPDVLGCIDGCYIYVRKPANKVRSTYINRHDLVSLTLQGICDADKRFVDVFLGAPSKIHDSRVFQLSYISNNLPEICGTQYHLLGDAAYPIKQYLLTPYKNIRNMDRQKQIYNKKHCATRVKIENAFGLLKNRFRQLVRLDFHTVERMSKFILACCVLHNLCIDGGDLWDAEEGTQNPEPINEEPVDPEQNDAVMQRLGEIKRSRISDSF